MSDPRNLGIHDKFFEAKKSKIFEYRQIEIRRLPLISFLIFVLIPISLFSVYKLFYQTKSFTAEARFTVRSQQELGPSSMNSGLSQIVGNLSIGSVSSDRSDLYAIRDYILSREIIEEIGGLHKLLTIYGRPEIDELSRLSETAKMEAALKYWKSKTTLYVNRSNNILVLQTTAFSAQDAQSLSEELITSTENFLNKMSARIRKAAFDDAQLELQRAAERLTQARIQLLKFQRRTNSFDPIENLKNKIKLRSKLVNSRLQLEVEIATLKAAGLDGTNSNLQTLLARLDIIEKQLNRLQTTLTGPDLNDTAVQILRDFELLKLDESFHTKMYEIARSTLETTRRKLDQQQKYVVLVVNPVLPESPSAPKPQYDILVAFCALLIFWVILILLTSAIRDR